MIRTRSLKMALRLSTLNSLLRYFLHPGLVTNWKLQQFVHHALLEYLNHALRGLSGCSVAGCCLVCGVFARDLCPATAKSHKRLCGGCLVLLKGLHSLGLAMPRAAGDSSFPWHVRPTFIV